VSLNAAGNGLQITKPGADITVTEVQGGQVAHHLGLYSESGAGASLVGQDVHRAVSVLTPLADLQNGSGIDLQNGLIITNGTHQETIDLSGAQTIEDVLNAINGAGLYVRIDLNQARNGLDLRTALNGASVTIGENGGTTATDLGVRSMPASVHLDELNDGQGVRTESGADFQIQRHDGVTLDVDVSDAKTVQDVLDLINNHVDNAGGLLLARLATTGNGIELVDQSAGANDLSVSTLNASPAATELGIAKTVSDPSASLTGDDVRPVRTTGLITALMDLRDALLADDGTAITRASERLTHAQDHTISTRAAIGIRVQTADLIGQRLSDEILDIEQMLSVTYDLDYAETVTSFTLLQNTFEAALRASETILNTSLLDLLW